MHAITWILAASLCSGCALIGAGRVSVGVTATTRGAVGLAVAGEVGGGVLFSSKGDSRGHGVGFTEGSYLGGGATAGGWELETGGHAELVVLDGDGELRAGVRAGIVGRQARGPAFAPELAFGLARARWWDSPRVGLELRAGPLLDLDAGGRFEALRGYVGLAYRGAVTTRSYEPPIDELFQGPEGKR